MAKKRVAPVTILPDGTCRYPRDLGWGVWTSIPETCPACGTAVEFFDYPTGEVWILTSPKCGHELVSHR